jgi:hypothetical protein
MPVTTTIGINNGGSPNAGDGSFGPFSKGQPNGSNHSTKTHERGPQRPSNPERVRAVIGLVGGGGEPPRQPTPTMTTPPRGRWIGDYD